MASDPPRHSPPGACSSTSDTSTSSGLPQPNIKVLFVSDLLMIRHALRLLLDANCCEVVAEVDDCETALKLAAANLPDIFLVDLDSSTAPLACLDDLVAAHDARIIVLAHPQLVTDYTTLAQYGAAGVVLKTAPAEVLIKAIKKVHAGEAWFDRAKMAKVLTRIARHRRAESVEAMKIAKLTRREREIITLVGEGLKNAAIAAQLFISEATVRNHLTSVLEKLGLSDRFELAVYAFRNRLVEYREPPAAERVSQTTKSPLRDLG